MIEFYRTKECPGCRQIEETLEGLRFGHKVHEVESTDDIERELPDGSRLPILIDEGKVYSGRENIVRHLEEVEAFKAEWYKFQSDACYCDDEGNVI